MSPANSWRTNVRFCELSCTEAQLVSCLLSKLEPSLVLAVQFGINRCANWWQCVCQIAGCLLPVLHLLLMSIAHKPPTKSANQDGSRWMGKAQDLSNSWAFSIHRLLLTVHLRALVLRPPKALKFKPLMYLLTKQSSTFKSSLYPNL